MMLYNKREQSQAQENPQTQEMMAKYHSPTILPNQCGSSLVRNIDAPVHIVWSIIKQFNKPQGYKRFVRNCTIVAGDGGIGSVRELELISGLPAKTSRERLDNLDDDLWLMRVSIIGGDHRLANYKSTTTLHETEEEKTTVIESYVVDIPWDSCKEDTCLFADTIIGFNLKSLARITEKMAA